MYLSANSTQLEHPSINRDPARFKRLLRLTPQFEFTCMESSDRRAAEDMVNSVFQQTYRANINSYMPHLLTMHCVGKLSGVAGVSLAGHRQLFLEQYLNLPIEKELSKLFNQPLRRGEIAEVGNLVAANNGASLAVFIVLACSLHRAGFTHMVFTATKSLRDKFERLGFQTNFLANAAINKLELVNQSDWGTYYDSNPQVVAGSLEGVLELVNDRPLYDGIKSAFSNQIENLSQQLILMKQQS